MGPIAAGGVAIPALNSLDTRIVVMARQRGDEASERSRGTIN